MIVDRIIGDHDVGDEKEIGIEELKAAVLLSTFVLCSSRESSRSHGD